VPILWVAVDLLVTLVGAAVGVGHSDNGSVQRSSHYAAFNVFSLPAATPVVVEVQRRGALLLLRLVDLRSHYEMIGHLYSKFKFLI